MAQRFLSNIRVNDAYTLPASDGSNGQVIVTDGSGNLAFADPSTSSSASVIYRDNFTGDGSTVAFTLQNSLSDEDQTFIYIDGVYQEKGTYSLNTNTITFTTAPDTGHSIEVISVSGINVGPTTIYQDNFTGDGTTTDFTLAQSIDNEVKTMIYFNGVYQFKGTYSLNNTTISFDTAPANGVDIEVISIASAAAADYNQKVLFYGKANEDISKGDAIMLGGQEGDHFLLSKATQTAIAANHEYFLGLASQDLVQGEFGYVTEFGKITEIDTSGYTAGDILWFDAGGSTAGALTTTEPAPPLVKIQVAAVIRSHQNEGVLFIRPTWYHELGELHDVNLTSVADKDILVWNNSNGYWENSKSLGDITATSFVKSGGTSSQFLKADGSIDSNTYLTTESDTLQSVVSRGSSVANTITIDGGNFEIFNSSFPDRRLTFNQSSGPIPRIYNYDQVGQSFHAIKIGGGNDDTTGLLIGDGNSPNTTIFGNIISQANEGKLVLNSTATNGKQYEFISIDTGNLGIYDGTAYRLWVNGNGNVGIGTTSPSYKLDVNGSSYSVISRFYNSATGAQIIVGSASNTSYSDIALTTSTGSAEFFRNGISTSYGGANSLNIWNSNGSIAFHPNNSSNALFIDTNSNVGIGLTNPSATLHTYKNSTDAYNIFESSTNKWVFGEAGGVCQVGGLYGLHSGINVDTSGQVGIGTGSPSAKLTVNGGIRIIGTGSGNSQLDLPIDYGALRWFNGSTFRGGIGTNSWSGLGGANDLGFYLVTGNKFHIGNQSSPFVTFDTSTERVGIKTTTPGYKLTVNGNIVALDANASNPSYSYFGLFTENGSLPGYPSNSFATLKTDDTDMYFSANGAYTAFCGWDSSNGWGYFGVKNSASSRNTVIRGGNGDSEFTGEVKRVGIGTNGSYYIALSGNLSGYTANAFNAIKTNQSDMHFDVGGVYTGYINANGGFTDVSDASLKTNIEYITNALTIVSNLKGRKYNWIDQNRGTGKQIGFIAQEVEEFVPEVVTEGAEGTKGVAYGKLTAVLVEAIKEQQAIIEDLKARIEILENN